jgi:hypothetical protein
VGIPERKAEGRGINPLPSPSLTPSFLPNELFSTKRKSF